jgi:hypothetical protein
MAEIVRKVFRNEFESEFDGYLTRLRRAEDAEENRAHPSDGQFDNEGDPKR